MNQVQLCGATDPQVLSKYVNNILQEIQHNKYEYIDIKYSSTMNNNQIYFSAIVIYKIN